MCSFSQTLSPPMTPQLRQKALPGECLTGPLFSFSVVVVLVPSTEFFLPTEVPTILALLKLLQLNCLWHACASIQICRFAIITSGTVATTVDCYFCMMWWTTILLEYTIFIWGADWFLKAWMERILYTSWKVNESRSWTTCSLPAWLDKSSTFRMKPTLLPLAICDTNSECGEKQCRH